MEIDALLLRRLSRIRGRRHQVAIEEFIASSPGITQNVRSSKKVDLSGIDSHIEGFPELLQGIDHLQGFPDRHVRVIGSLSSKSGVDSLSRCFTGAER